MSGFEEPGEPLLLQDMALFRPGTVYPHLRLVDLQLEHYARVIPLSEQQLQLLCSCCPALRRLTLWSCPTPSPPTALLPLGELSALTHLAIFKLRAAAPLLSAVVSSVATLTGLKQLRLMAALEDPMEVFANPQPAIARSWVQLTALTALEALDISVQLRGPRDQFHLKNQVRVLVSLCLPTHLVQLHATTCMRVMCHHYSSSDTVDCLACI